MGLTDNTPTSIHVMRLDQLYADRARLAGEIKRLTDASTRLLKEAAGEAALLNELDKLAATETADMRAWADAGCRGAPPAGRQTERLDIAGRLAAFKATASAARGVISEIDGQIGELVAQHAVVDDAVHVAALDIMEGEFAETFEEHRVAAMRTRLLTAKLAGLGGYLSNEGRRLIDIQGDQVAGKKYFARVEALGAIKFTDVGVTHQELIEAANDWSKRAETLRKGSQS